MPRTVTPLAAARTVARVTAHGVLYDDDTGEALLDDDTGEPLWEFAAYLQPRTVKEVPVSRATSFTTGETGRQIPFQLTDSDGEPPNLVGATIVVYAKPRVGDVVEITTVEGLPDGVALVTIPGGLDDGSYPAEFRVNGNGYTDATFPDETRALPFLRVRAQFAPEED